MVQMIPEKSYFMGRNKKDGKEHFRAELLADYCSDLVGLTELDNRVFEPGSVALCGKEPDACVLMFDGKWYRQSNGNEVTL